MFPGSDEAGGNASRNPGVLVKREEPWAALETY